MRRTGWIFIIACVLMLGAGFVLGCLWELRARPQTDWRDQLHLTAAQRQQFDAIWSPVHKEFDGIRQRGQQLDQDRQLAVGKLLGDAQKVEYDKIQKEYRDRSAALDQEREKIIPDANQRSRALLDEKQKAIWDGITNKQHEHHRRAGATQPSTSRPASRPTDSNL
jgi:hypothetical protein